MANGKIVKYPRGTCFTEVGEIGRYVGIIKSGYFKFCALNAIGDYAVTGLSFPDDCIMDFTQSFVFNKPSKISIIAGNDAEVLQVSLKTLREYIVQNNPGIIPHMTAVILEEAYRRYLNLYQCSPTERYLELIEKYPQVLKCVTLRDIASFLLITPTHLSRIRKNILDQSKNL